MNTQINHGTATILAGILLGVVGLSMPNISPIFLGAAADHLGFSYEQIGLLGGLEILGISLTAVSAVFWIQRVDLRRAALAGLLVCVIGNLLSAMVEGFAALVSLRVLIGILGEGVVFSLGVALLGETRNPDRSFALMVTAQVAWMMSGMLGLPYSAAAWGMAGVVVPVALAIALVIPTVRYLPAALQSVDDNQGIVVKKAPVAWLIAAQFVWYCGALAIFAFIERIGNEAGFEATRIGAVLAIGMGMSLLGSLLATVQGDRFRRWPPFVATMAIQAGFAWMLIDVDSLRTYALAWIVINTVWNYGLPYIYASVSAADPSGRFVVMVPAAQGFGGAIGAMLAGVLVSRYGLQGVVFLLIAANTLAAICFLTGVRSGATDQGAAVD